MECIILTEENREEILARVEAVIRAEGIAAMPTDTVYGLVCDASNESAIIKMRAIKRRPREKAFPIFARDIAMARRYAYILDAKAGFLENIWPGSVTAVFRHKEKLPVILTGGRDTIGIRVPDHPFVAALLEKCDAPLAQTSVNISDMPPAKNADEVKRYFDGAEHQPDLLIDGGKVSGAPSTVVDFTGAVPLILRSGIVSKADIDLMIGIR